MVLLMSKMATIAFVHTGYKTQTLNSKNRTCFKTIPHILSIPTHSARRAILMLLGGW